MDESNPLAGYNPEASGTPETIQQPTVVDSGSNVMQCNTVENAIPQTVEVAEVALQQSVDNALCIPKIFSDIDKMVAVIYQKFEVVDSSFGKISKFFFDAAENVEQGRDPKYLSQEEEDVQLLYTIMGYAAKSLGKIVNVASSQSQISQLKPVLKQMALERINYYREILAQVRALSDGSYNELNTIMSSSSFGDNIKLALKNYREARYHYLLLCQFIVPQFEDWAADNFSREYNLPDLQDVNNELLFTRESSLFISTKQAKESLASALENNCKLNKVKLLISDSGLMATLQVALSDSPFALAEIASNATDKESAVYKEYTSNKAVQENMYMASQMEEVDWAYTKQLAIYLVRNLVVDVALLIPAYSYLGIGWAIAITVALLLFTWYNLEKVIEPIEEIKANKEERIKTYANTLARKSSGEKPKLRQIGAIQRKNKAVIICAILLGLMGAAIGNVIGLVLGIFLGALIGDAFSGSDKTNTLTDGEDWDEVQFGSAIWSKIITIIAVIIIVFEIFG
jgi:hypothetical protein